jgi:hypothetical protein
VRWFVIHKHIELPEALFLLDSLCYSKHSRLRRHLMDTDPTLEDGAFQRIEKAIMERVLQKIV